MIGWDGCNNTQSKAREICPTLLVIGWNACVVMSSLHHYVIISLRAISLVEHDVMWIMIGRWNARRSRKFRSTQSKHLLSYGELNKKTNITPFWANVILWEFCSILSLFLLLILRNLTQWLNPYIFELTKSWGSSWYNFHSGNSISWKIEKFSSSFSADQIFIFTSKIGLKSSALCSETNPTERTTIPLKLTKIWRILQSGSQLLT